MANTASSSADSPGLSGKRFTVGVLVILLVLFSGIAYFLTMVHRLDRTRSETSECWRQVAVLLDREYRQLERLENTSLDGQLPDQWQEQFEQLADRFRTAVDPLEQRSLAEQAEKAIAELSSSEGTGAVSSGELRQRVQAYNQSLTNEREILDSVGGRLVTTFLVIPRQENFQLKR